MKLSPHFTYKEMIRSQTAENLGIDNTPPDDALISLTALANAILEPARRVLAVPLRITSGYRCLEVNRSVGGARNSQHTLGEAADFAPIGMAVEKAALTLAAMSNLPFAQLIYEVRERAGKAPLEWIHISYNRNGENKGEVLTIHMKDGAKTTHTGVQSIL